MPLHAGLLAAAVICVVLGLTGVAILIVTARRAAFRLFAAADAVGAAGAATVALTGALVGGRATEDVRLQLAAGFDVAFALSTALVLAGLLVLPRVAGCARVRLRHAADGLLLAAGGFFTGWTLVVQPLYDARAGGQISTRLSDSYLTVAVPSVLAIAALGLLVAIVVRSAPLRGGLIACCVGAALASVSGLGFALALRYGDGTAVLAAAIGYAAGYLLLAVSAESVDRQRAASPEPAVDRAGISFVPVVMVTAACLIRLLSGGELDDVGLSTAVVIFLAFAVQLVLDHRELRHYAEERARSEWRYRVMAHTDSLTGLANRRQLLWTLHEEAVGGPPCVLLAIDLDGFKNINDIRGHDVGDAVLVEVANRLRTNLRPGDLAARLGGDEFAVLMWARPAEARVVSERLLRVLSRPYELPTGTAFVSASIGLAGCATAGDVPTLLRNADLALRFAKQRGKRRVEQYDAAYDEQVRRRTELEHELRGAAERGELMVVYQPVVRLPDAEHRHARVIGVEALVAWHHPRLGAVPPEELIPVAEESGLICGLGSFVLHEACHQLSSWQSEGHDLWLAVNVSIRELHTAEYAAALAQVVERLTALRATGVRVALDDFGSRYSSLAQLRSLPVDILKIGPSFLDADRFTGPLVDVVVSLGRRPGLDVIAQGISEPAQCRLLLEAGCRYAQGALLGVAMPAERVEAVFGADLPLPETAILPAQDVRPVDSAHEMRQS